MSPDIEIDENPLGQAGVEYIEKLDVIRKTDFEQYFPELAHLIK